MSRSHQPNPIPPELSRLVRSVRLRLWFERFLATLHDALLVAMVAMLVVVVLAKVSPSLQPTWWIVFSILGGLALVGALLMARVGRLSDGAIAALIDERLGLKDRFTTAIHCAHRDDPFARAALEEGMDTLRDRSMRDRIAAAFSPRLPGGGWIAPVIGLFAGLLWFTVPAGDLFAKQAEPDQQAVLEERLAAEESVRAVLQQIEENPALSEELGDLSEAFALDESRPDDPESAEQARREALRKISDLEQRLDQVVNGERGKSMEALKQSLSQLDVEGTDQTRELAEALRSSNFEAAQKALEKLSEAMNDPSMSEADREELANELKSLAEKLKSAADQKEALKQALQQAGMDPDLANNPEAMEQALQQATGLNQEQIEQLQQMSAAQKSASEQCQNMSKSLGQMAQQCQNPQQQGQQSQQGQQGMQKSLSEAEQMKQMLQMAKSAQGQCKGCNGSKPSGTPGSYASMLDASKPNAATAPGQKPGKPGEGFGDRAGPGGGGNAPVSATNFSTQLQKENVALQEGGDIISRQLVDSESPVVGESTLELQQVAETIIRSWEEGVDEQPIPGHLREVHKHYFGELKKRIDARRRTAPVAPASPDDAGGSTTDAPSEAPPAAPSEEAPSDTPS